MSKEGEAEVVERSPQGRYVRYDTVVGSGSFKTVWKGQDMDTAMEIAWNTINITHYTASNKLRILEEVKLLRQLSHECLLKFYASWFNKEKMEVVFITELFHAGTLKYFTQKYPISMAQVKKYSKSILECLAYLHGQPTPVIHRDLKCDNIFIDGGDGNIKIGDLGLSTNKDKANTVLGTPEFMAPEMYEAQYTETVDIYAFGMCVLEMITKKPPYYECTNVAQVMKKVTNGQLPDGMAELEELWPDAYAFVKRCVVMNEDKSRPSAMELLDDNFLVVTSDDKTRATAHPEEEDKAVVHAKTAPTAGVGHEAAKVESSPPAVVVRRHKRAVTEVAPIPEGVEDDDSGPEEDVPAAVPAACVSIMEPGAGGGEAVADRTTPGLSIPRRSVVAVGESATPTSSVPTPDTVDVPAGTALATPTNNALAAVATSMAIEASTSPSSTKSVIASITEGDTSSSQGDAAPAIIEPTATTTTVAVAADDAAAVVQAQSDAVATMAARAEPSPTTNSPTPPSQEPAANPPTEAAAAPAPGGADATATTASPSRGDTPASAPGSARVHVIVPSPANSVTSQASSVADTRPELTLRPAPSPVMKGRAEGHGGPMDQHRRAMKGHASAPAAAAPVSPAVATPPSPLPSPAVVVAEVKVQAKVQPPPVSPVVVADPHPEVGATLAAVVASGSAAPAPAPAPADTLSSLLAPKAKPNPGDDIASRPPKAGPGTQAASAGIATGSAPRASTGPIAAAANPSAPSSSPHTTSSRGHSGRSRAQWEAGLVKAIRGMQRDIGQLKQDQASIKQTMTDMATGQAEMKELLLQLLEQGRHVTPSPRRTAPHHGHTQSAHSGSTRRGSGKGHAIAEAGKGNGASSAKSAGKAPSSGQATSALNATAATASQESAKSPGRGHGQGRARAASNGSTSATTPAAGSSSSSSSGATSNSPKQAEGSPSARPSPVSTDKGDSSEPLSSMHSSGVASSPSAWSSRLDAHSEDVEAIMASIEGQAPVDAEGDASAQQAFLTKLAGVPLPPCNYDGGLVAVQQLSDASMPDGLIEELGVLRQEAVSKIGRLEKTRVARFHQLVEENHKKKAELKQEELVLEQKQAKSRLKLSKSLEAAREAARAEAGSEEPGDGRVNRVQQRAIRKVELLETSITADNEKNAKDLKALQERIDSANSGFKSRGKKLDSNYLASVHKIKTKHNLDVAELLLTEYKRRVQQQQQLQLQQQQQQQQQLLMQQQAESQKPVLDERAAAVAASSDDARMAKFTDGGAMMHGAPVPAVDTSVAASAGPHTLSPAQGIVATPTAAMMSGPSSARGGFPSTGNEGSLSATAPM